MGGVHRLKLRNRMLLVHKVRRMLEAHLEGLRKKPALKTSSL